MRKKHPKPISIRAQNSTFWALINLYPICHRILVVALAKEYSILFPSYLNKKSYMCVAEDGMHLCNHDFNETAELVCSNLFSLPLSFLFECKFSCRHFFIMPPLLQVITVIQNMAHQHRELHLRLDDTEQLRRYAGSAVSKHNSLDDALSKARAKSRH